MGTGYKVKCKKCWFVFEVFGGIGFMFPQKYEGVIEDIKAGKLGEEIRIFFERHGNAAVNVEQTVLKCVHCGNLETGDDLSVYIPLNENDDCSDRKEIWSFAFPAKGYRYVTPHELEEKYKKVIEYPHKCSKCSGKMKIISENEINGIRCPKCNGEMKDAGKIYWD